MRPIDKKLVLKVIILTVVFWFSLQFVFLHYLVNRADKGPQSSGDTNVSSPARVAAALLKRYGGAGGSNSRLGEGGKAVRLPPALVADSKAKFDLNQFDVVISDLISVNRSLPEVRHPSCLKSSAFEAATQSGLNTSVVIVFHNEAWSTLLRTVHSVLNRSPPSLLHEIILVDDASDRDFLGSSLTTYVDTLGPRVHLIRLPKRSGLIRARLSGAKAARGSTLTFLDAHCEVTDGWLEPLVAHVASSPRAVVCPAIDVISENNFEYLLSTEKTWGIFGWDLLFDWDVVSKREEKRRQGNPTAPIRTPAMAGGLFLIRREFFYELGSYDDGMIVWGVENVEMSLRVWQCGGELLIVPCSRVGHVFRRVSPYTWPGGFAKVLNHNRVRTARVWLDSYAALPYAIEPDLKTFNAGDVSERVELRKRLQCKNFAWYLENIFPECTIRLNITHLGQVRNPVHNVCFDTGNGQLRQSISAAPCHRSRVAAGATQAFSVSSAGEITSSVGCLSARRLHDPLVMAHCDSPTNTYQKFTYNREKKHIVHDHSKLCVRVDMSQNEMPLFLEKCDNSDEFVWQLPPAFKGAGHS